MMEKMNGAEALVRTLVDAGVNTCFANPGTSEMHFVSALDRVPGMRCVLGLAETVVTGCADGYGRMMERPAVTLLHCGPGLANGLANLHNARRAGTPIVNIVGDHATYHTVYDTPLTSDIEGLAKPMSHWVKTSRSAAEVAADAVAAIQAAGSNPGKIATLILPADTAWGESSGTQPPLEISKPPPVGPETIRHALNRLRQRGPTMLLLGGTALTKEGLAAAQKIASATGCSVRTTTFVARLPRGRNQPPVDRLPYSVDEAVTLLEKFENLILVGAPPPAAFFAYPNKASELWGPGTEVFALATPEEDATQVLVGLADELGSVSIVLSSHPAAHLEAPTGTYTPAGFAQALSRLIPENAIIMEDAVTSGRGLFPPTFGAAPHDWLQNTGGAIGGGMPTATGAAIACPDRRVICLQADGAGMYSLQALWTQARERLNVVTIVFANRAYRILQGELKAVGAREGPTSERLFSLADPSLDWVKLAQGMGVGAASTSTLEGLQDLLSSALRNEGPFLIEMVC
jgi:acetolactate synthase-1/2/3 large subunit